MRVRDGKEITRCATARNSKNCIELLKEIEADNPTGDIFIITDNLSSHNSLETRTWLLSLTLFTVAAQTISRAFRAGRWSAPGAPVLLEETGVTVRWKIFLATFPLVIVALLVLFNVHQQVLIGVATRFSTVEIGGTLVLLLLILRLVLATLEVRSLRKAPRVKNAQLEQLATHDPLTGTLNHRALLEKLDETLVQAHETHTPCALLFLDLDHFEAMNDQYGHLVGDQVLCQKHSLADSAKPMG